MGRYYQFQRIAEIEFRQIVSGTDDFGHKLRIYFIDKSYLDLFISTQSEIQRYSFHWEKRHIEKIFYRLDNTPDPKWEKVETFPLHFHNKTYNKVIFSQFKFHSLEDLFREFMKFVQKAILPK